MPIATTNPATGETLKTFPVLSFHEIQTKISLADDVYQKSFLSLEATQKKRRDGLLHMAELLIDQKEALGKLITLEMGKTLASAIQEIEKCALNCQYYAENGLQGLNAEPIPLPDDRRRAEIRYLPIGTVLAVMPWNFPFWQVIRCAAPILLSGNSMLLKHASNVPQCSEAIENLFIQAGFEPGVFQSLLIGSEQVAFVIQDVRVHGVTLTGSEAAGKSVGSLASKSIKKSVLELGGSDPFIVMPSANISRAAEVAVKARMICNGQSCIAAKRFIIHGKVYDQFKKYFIENMMKIKMGDPMDPSTALGPVVSIKAREELHSLVMDAVGKGGRLLLGGKIPEGDGSFYPATVLDQVPKEARVIQEEVFGPVAVLYQVATLREAIKVANSTRFGLGASFWSREEDEISTATHQIQSGSVFVNDLVASDPHFPFGGVKSSGYGRELGQVGLREFTNIKTVVNSRE